MSALPEVTLTALLVDRRPAEGRPGGSCAVVVLSDAEGRMRTVVAGVRRGQKTRNALFEAVAGAFTLLKRPAAVTVVCNHERVCNRLRQGGEVDPGPHALTVKHRRGDAMGKPGRRAYAAGLRHLERTAAAE